MKRFRILLISSLLMLSVLSLSQCHHGGEDGEKSRKNKTVESKLLSIMMDHQKLLDTQLLSLKQDVLDSDRAFLIDTSFTRERMTRNFFQTIKASVEEGRIPGGLMRMSYTSMTSINGQFKAVHYSYNVDGKNVTLVRSTNNNGNVLKAVYQYNRSGKLLDIREYKGDQLLHKKEHEIKI